MSFEKEAKVSPAVFTSPPSLFFTGVTSLVLASLIVLFSPLITLISEAASLDEVVQSGHRPRPRRHTAPCFFCIDSSEISGVNHCTRASRL